MFERKDVDRRTALKALGASIAGTSFAGIGAAKNAQRGPKVETIMGSKRSPVAQSRAKNKVRGFINRYRGLLRSPAIGSEDGVVVPEFNLADDEEIIGLGVGADPNGTLRTLTVTTGGIEQVKAAERDVERQAPDLPDIRSLTQRRLSTFEETTTNEVTTQSCSGTRRFRKVEIDDWSCPFTETGRLQYGDEDNEGTHEIWDQVYNEDDLIGTTTNYQQTPGVNYNASSDWVCWNTNTRHGYDDNTNFGEPYEVYTAPDSTSSEGKITGASASVGPYSFGVGFSWSSPPIVINDQHNNSQAQWLVNINGQYDTQRERGFASICDFDGSSPDTYDTVVRVEADAEFTNGPIYFGSTYGAVHEFNHDEYYSYY